MNTDWEQADRSGPALSVCFPVAVHCVRAFGSLKGISAMGKEGRTLIIQIPLRTLFLLPGCLSSVECVKARRCCKNTLVGPKWIKMMSSVSIRTFDNRRGLKGWPIQTKSTVLKGRESQYNSYNFAPGGSNSDNVIESWMTQRCSYNQPHKCMFLGTGTNLDMWSCGQSSVPASAWIPASVSYWASAGSILPPFISGTTFLFSHPKPNVVLANQSPRWIGKVVLWRHLICPHSIPLQ